MGLKKKSVVFSDRAKKSIKGISNFIKKEKESQPTAVYVRNTLGVVAK
jgi:ribosomal protein L31E